MKWIEIINLRSAGASRESIGQQVPRVVTELDRDNNLMSVKVYCQATIDTDMSIHLLFEATRPEVQPSALGQRLASALKEFGLVNHSVWIEQEEPRTQRRFS